MKKSGFLLSVLLMLLIVLPVNAQTPRLVNNYTSLYFEETTAYCEVYIIGRTSKDSISATMTLWNGSQPIKSWTLSGTGYLSHTGTTTVKKGQSYELTVDYTVAGVSQPSLSHSATCK